MISMKWWPGDCKPGDMIRVHIGSIDHYGIFVSEDEVIQFGLPPGCKDRPPEDMIEVIATDIDVFSCGKIIEVAELDRKEKKAAYSSEKIIANARAGLGKKGYNLVHNNCEHFVNECVFGVHRSSQEENVRNAVLKKLRKNV